MSALDINAGALQSLQRHGGRLAAARRHRYRVRMTSTPIRAVFLDFDGTLAHMQPSHWALYAEAARAAGLIADRDADELAASWRMATAIRNAVMLVRGRPSDMVPTDARELRAVSYVLGYPLGDSGRMIDDYKRTTRRARQVFERLFYGEDD